MQNRILFFEKNKFHTLKNHILIKKKKIRNEIIEIK